MCCDSTGVMEVVTITLVGWIACDVTDVVGLVKMHARAVLPTAILFKERKKY